MLGSNNQQHSILTMHNTPTPHPFIYKTTLFYTQLTNTCKHSFGTRCRDGVKVLCCSCLVWLVFEDFIPICACFRLANFYGFLCRFQLVSFPKWKCDRQNGTSYGATAGVCPHLQTRFAVFSMTPVQEKLLALYRGMATNDCMSPSGPCGHFSHCPTLISKSTTQGEI